LRFENWLSCKKGCSSLILNNSYISLLFYQHNTGGIGIKSIDFLIYQKPPSRI